MLSRTQLDVVVLTAKLEQAGMQMSRHSNQELNVQQSAQP